MTSKYASLGLCLALLGSFVFCTSPALAQPSAGQFVDGELLVKFKNTNNQLIDNALNSIGAQVVEKLSSIQVSRLKLPAGMSLDSARQKLTALGIVKYAEPNYILKHFWEPNDPKFSQQWGLKKIDALKGWGSQTGTNKVKIAIVDTGVDMDHPDLKNKLVSGYDFVDNDGWPDDEDSHGTHCAGIAAAATNNGKGVSGVCPNCAIMPVRVLGGGGGSSSDVAKGIIWAADHGAKVISMSLGSPYPSTAISDAINYASGKGSLMIAAAGNSNTDSYHYPAYFSKCIAVGSTDHDDSRSDFSNYGNWVDVAAPGSWIVSTVPNGSYEKKSGTSMAAPYVAGLAGLLFSCPGASANKVRNAIEGSAHPVGSWNAKGRIDVSKALNKMGCGNGNSGSGGGGSNNSSGNAKHTGPSGYHLTWGKTVSAPGNSLVKSDDSRLVLKCKGQGSNNVLDFYVSSKGQNRNGAKKLYVKLEGSFSKAGEVTAYFYNWDSNNWDWIGKQYLDGNDKTVYFTRQNPAPYISGQGEVRVRFFRKAKRWTWFEIKGDFIQFTVEK